MNLPLTTESTPWQNMNTTPWRPMANWSCEHWQNMGTLARPNWQPDIITVAASTREMARERAARCFGCLSCFVTVRYLSNK